MIAEAEVYSRIDLKVVTSADLLLHGQSNLGTNEVTCHYQLHYSRYILFIYVS